MYTYTHVYVYIWVCCSVLQCAAECLGFASNELVTMCCSVLQHVTVTVCCNVWRGGVVCESIVLHVL